MTLESWLKPARILFGLVSLVVGATAAALTTAHTTDGKADKALEVATRAADSAKTAADAVVQLRADTERQARESRQEMEARLAVMARERQEDRDARIRLEEQLKAIGSQVQDTRGDIRVLLDRLNATPRQRTARDYP